MGVDSLRGSLPGFRPEPVTAGKVSRLPTSPAPAANSATPSRPSGFDQSRFDVASRAAVPGLFDAPPLSPGAFNDRFSASGSAAGVPGLPASVPLPPPRPGTGTGTGDAFTVDRGQVTFDAEGQETRGAYFSREAHWPGGASGVTIGRGYDMKQRTQAGVLADLTAAGVPPEQAERLSQGAGLSGANASKFRDEVADIEITPEAQKALFNTVYDEHAADVQRISDKPDVVAAYGATDWANLDPAIKDTLVDLRYRGDYTGTTRKELQSLIAANDLQGLRDLLADEDKMINEWHVPRDRFERRRDFLDTALAERATQQPAQ